MFQESNSQTIAIFPLLMGTIVILLALFNRPLLRFVKIKPSSEIFTNSRFQHSAKITEKLAQLFLVVFGISSLVQGIGPLFLSSETTYIISITVLGLSGLIILSAVGVVLANWKAK